MTIEWLKTNVFGESIEQACGTRVAIKGNDSLPTVETKRKRGL